MQLEQVEALNQACALLSKHHSVCHSLSLVASATLPRCGKVCVLIVRKHELGHTAVNNQPPITPADVNKEAQDLVHMCVKAQQV